MPKVNDSNSNSSASTPAHTQTTTLDSHGASDGRVATFIRKVYNILEEQLFPDIVDWSADGLAIVIKKPTEFSQKVLPKYFKHNHISSFIRQLNMYSFQKKRSRHAGHIYAHDLFQKGAKHLLCQIKRKVKDFANTSTGSGGEAPVTSTPSVNATPVNANTSNPGHPDVSALVSENQLLKNLQEQNMLKMQALENKIKELSTMNQRLQVQMQQGKEINNNNVANVQPPKVQQIYNLNTAMLVGGRNPFTNMVPAPKIESEPTSSLSPVKGLSLRINKPGPQSETERYMIGGQNAFTIGGPFAGVNATSVNTKTKSEEEVSPSATRPSPQNSDNANSELDAWGQHLLHQSQQHQHLHQHYPQAFMLNGAQNFQNIAQQRLSIGQTQGLLSNLSDNRDHLQIPGYIHNLGKRELELDDIKQGEQPIRKVVQRNWNDLGATLNLSDIKKFHSNLFSSVGDKEFDPKQTDTEIDLLCFE